MTEIELEDPIHRCHDSELAQVPDYPEWAHYNRTNDVHVPDLYYLTRFDGEVVGFNIYSDVEGTWNIHLSYVDRDGFTFFHGGKLISHRMYPEDAAGAHRQVNWLLENLPAALMVEALR